MSGSESAGGASGGGKGKGRGKKPGDSKRDSTDGSGTDPPTKGKGSSSDSMESSSDSEKVVEQRTTLSGGAGRPGQSSAVVVPRERFPAHLNRQDWDKMLSFRNLHKKREMLYNKKMESSHSVGKRVEVVTNHYRVKIPDDIKMYQYAVEIHRRSREDTERFPTGPVRQTTQHFKTRLQRLERDVLRQVFWQAVKDQQTFFGNPYAIIYDGQNICFMQKKIEHLKYVASVTMPTFDDNHPQGFLVFITFAGPIGIEIDSRAMQEKNYKEGLEYCRTKLQVLDLLIRQSRSCPISPMASKFVPAGGNMFMIPVSPRPQLKPNLEHWQGFFQAHSMCQDGTVSLNFDVANSGFFKPQLHFVDFLCQTMAHMMTERGQRPPPGAWVSNSSNIRPGPNGTNIFTDYPGDLSKDLRTARVGKMVSKLNSNPRGIQVKWTYRMRDGSEVVRVKRLVGFSDKPANETTFVMKAEDCEKLGIPVTHALVSQPPRGRGRGTVGSRGGTGGGSGAAATTSGAEISVAEYYRVKHGITLDFPLLPPLIFKGRGSGQEKIPMEFCWVYGPQRFTGELNQEQLQAIIKEAATPAVQRKSKIQELANACNFSQDPWLQAYQYNVNLNMVSLTKVNVLPPPSIIYGNNARAQPRDGTWKHPPRAKFFRPGRIDGFALMTVNLSQMDQNNARGRWLVDFITRDCANFGIQSDTNNYQEKHVTDLAMIPQALKEMKKGLTAGGKGGTNFIVFCVLPRKDATVYSAVKRSAEVEVGVMTQCILIKTVKGFKPMTGENIALKVNCKLGGVNWVLQPASEVASVIPKHWPKKWSDKPMLVLGVDVVHPAPTMRPGHQTTYPSVAAIVGNTCDEFKSFRGNIKLQCRRQEHIVYMMEAVKERLRDYVDTCGKKPELIVVYRDGVAEGSYQDVLVEEISRIKGACYSLDQGFKPKIAVVVANKRHHTRFFPGNPTTECGRAKNVPPGTTVNNTVTSPSGPEFYQVAHFGIQGTSRPVKYSVIFNEGDQPLDFIENLTFHLTHAFHRCPRSVHIPGPLYLADLLCRRADCYIKHMSFGSSDESRSHDRGAASFRDETSTVQGSGSGSGSITGRSEGTVATATTTATRKSKESEYYGKGKGSSSSENESSDTESSGQGTEHVTGKSGASKAAKQYSSGEEPEDMGVGLSTGESYSLLNSIFHLDDANMEDATRIDPSVQQMGLPFFM